jgi:hypothetical protein
MSQNTDLPLSGRRVICTLFDERYMSRGLSMIDSVHRYAPDLVVMVLCLTDRCLHAVRKMAQPGIKPIAMAELEGDIPRLLEAKKNRTTLEYYFTCMAALHRFVLDRERDVDTSMYVDADMLFYCDPNIVFEAIGDSPVAIIPHNFAPHLEKSHMRYGRFNAGWTAFRRTPEGEICLDWWLERSLEWCYDRVDGDRYANQKYLNKFSLIAPNTRILTQKGFDAAPWNIGRFRVSLRDGRVFLDDEPLVFFHFHRLKKQFGIFFFDPHRAYRAPMSRLVRNHVYRPYVETLLANDARIETFLGPGVESLKAARGSMFGIDFAETAKEAGRMILRILDLLSLRPIMIWRGRAL